MLSTASLRAISLPFYVRVRRIELRSTAWEAVVLPLNYTRSTLIQRETLRSTRVYDTVPNNYHQLKALSIQVLGVVVGCGGGSGSMI